MTDTTVWIAEGDPRHGAALLLTDTAPPPGPWLRALLTLIFLTLAGQAMANGADDMIRHRGAGPRATRPPIERNLGRAPSATRTTGRAWGEAL